MVQISRGPTGIPIKLAEHSSLSGDVVANASSGQIHQLVNNSITHTWGITTWDLLGNINLAQTWNAQYTDLNWQGLSLLRDP